MNADFQPEEPVPAVPEEPKTETQAEIPAAPLTETPAWTAEEPAAVKPPKNKKKIILTCGIIAGVFALLVLLVGGYYLGGYLLSRQIETKHAAKDCQGVVSTGKTVESFFPTSIVPFVEPALAKYQECLPYAEAENAKNGGAWENAYNSYVKYYEQNPQGILTPEAREGAAQSLLSWAQELAGNKEYETAIEKLTVLLENHSDSTVFNRAREDMAGTYIGWASQWAAAQDYETAIAKVDIVLADYADTTFLDIAREDKAKYLVAWARLFQENKEYSTAIEKLDIVLADYDETVAAQDARALLPQVYFDWAQLQASEAEYAKAEKNYKTAISKDPDPQSTTGPAAQTKAAFPQFYINWAEADLDKGDFTTAMVHFELALQYAPADLVPTIKEAEMRCQMDWATDFAKDEEFFTALNHLDEADKYAPNENMKGEVDAARASILDQFSKSDGEDALIFKKQTARDLCKSGKLPELPIAGIDTNSERIYDFFTKGDDTLTLDSSVMATTPGQLHIIACVEEEKEDIEKCPYSGGYTIVRQRLDWTIELFDVVTGEKIDSRDFKGGNPDRCEYWEIFFSRVKYKIGDPPASNVVNEWLLEFVR